MCETTDEQIELIPTLAALNKCDWQTRANNAENYYELMNSLYQLEKQVEENTEEQLSLQWLRALSTMRFSRKIAINEPFTSMSENGSATMESFKSNAILNYFCDVFESIADSNLLKARLGDLLWTLRKPSKLEHALGAIDAYMSQPLKDTLNWHSLYEPCWERAIVMCNALKSGVGKRGEFVESTLYNQISDSKQDLHWRTRLAELALNNSPLLTDKAASLGQLFEALGKQSSDSNEHWLAQKCLEICGGFYARAKNNDKCIETTVSLADSFSKEGLSIYLKKHNGRFLQAPDKFEKAIQLYLSVPKSLRKNYNIEEKIEAAQEKAKECNIEAQRLMPSHSLSPDIAGGLTDLAKEATSSDNASEALLGLVSLITNINVGKIKHEVESSQGVHFLSSFMNGAAVHFETDGRVTERIEGVNQYSNDLDKDSVEYKKWLYHEILMAYKTKIEIIAISCIQPGLIQIKERHILSERYFVDLAFKSSFIPSNRYRLLGKGLHMGYVGEYGAAMHILAPQLEGVVRQHLVDCGIDSNYVDVRNNHVDRITGLSALIDNHREILEKIYGASDLFEIDALFCQSALANLRNDVAHGLLDDNRSNNLFTMYAWVFLLKLALPPFHNSERVID